MNFCINSWESCDYWPQATVLNGSAGSFSSIELSSSHHIYRVKSESDAEPEKFVYSARIVAHGIVDLKRRWRSFFGCWSFFSATFDQLLLSNSRAESHFDSMRNNDLKLATLGFVMLFFVYWRCPIPPKKFNFICPQTIFFSRSNITNVFSLFQNIVTQCTQKMRSEFRAIPEYISNMKQNAFLHFKKWSHGEGELIEKMAPSLSTY